MNNKQEPFIVGQKSYTAVAIRTASHAGSWIRSRVGEFTQLNQKYSIHDVVTEIDRGAEMMIRNMILTYFPEHAFLGEEGVEPGPQAAIRATQEASEAEYLWIVDPIDGTTNFVHGFPFFCVSIALAYRGEIIVGVIYDPSKDEMFVAEKGKGAYLSGKPIHVSSETSLATSLVATGFPADRDGALVKNLLGIQVITPQVRNIRVAGSAALHLAYVAAGRLSGFWEIGLNAWDMAAGIILIQEAGGQVTDTLGQPYQLLVRNVLATNGAIHQAMQQQLAHARATGLE
jgi:myo-inositol-1(or 4)-monophosphatase